MENKKILIIGGTGALGKTLIILSANKPVPHAKSRIFFGVCVK